nr:MAG TPA: hypothetical protein [Caudoviricetes sp.]
MAVPRWLTGERIALVEWGSSPQAVTSTYFFIFNSFLPILDGESL